MDVRDILEGASDEARWETVGVQRKRRRVFVVLQILVTSRIKGS